MRDFKVSYTKTTRGCTLLDGYKIDAETAKKIRKGGWYVDIGEQPESEDKQDILSVEECINVLNEFENEEN